MVIFRSVDSRAILDIRTWRRWCLLRCCRLKVILFPVHSSFQRSFLCFAIGFGTDYHAEKGYHDAGVSCWWSRHCWWYNWSWKTCLLAEAMNFGWNGSSEFCSLVALPRISQTFSGMPLPYVISVYRLVDFVLSDAFVPWIRLLLALTLPSGIDGWKICRDQTASVFADKLVLYGNNSDYFVSRYRV